MTTTSGQRSCELSPPSHAVIVTSTDNAAGCGLSSPPQTEWAPALVREKLPVLVTCIALENLVNRAGGGMRWVQVQNPLDFPCSYLRKKMKQIFKYKHFSDYCMLLFTSRLLKWLFLPVLFSFIVTFQEEDLLIFSLGHSRDFSLYNSFLRVISDSSFSPPSFHSSLSDHSKIQIWWYLSHNLNTWMPFHFP